MTWCLPKASSKVTVTKIRHRKAVDDLILGSDCVLIWIFAHFMLSASIIVDASLELEADVPSFRAALGQNTGYWPLVLCPGSEVTKINETV